MLRRLGSCCLLLMMPWNVALAHKPYATVHDFLADQSIIRILIDNASGYGLQVASYHLTLKLRKLGFHGTFEIIYPESVKDKVTTLFDLPKQIPTVYNDRAHQQRFITLQEFIRRHKNKTAEQVTLGMSGGLNKGPSGIAANDKIDVFQGMETIDYMNHANFMNVAVFAQLITYYKFSNYLYVQNNMDYKHYPQAGSEDKFMTTSVNTLAQTKEYLDSTAHGKKLATQLAPFIHGMETQQFNVLPVYGITLKADCKNYPGSTGCFPGNILQIITAARYAQLNGAADFHKPLVIAVFYDFDAEAKRLSELMHATQWGSDEQPGGVAARKAINTLQLSNHFFTANLHDPDITQRLHELKPNDILLLSLNALPTPVFDSLFNYTNTNIWPAIREGNNSFATLVLTGKPHLRCGNRWELGELAMQDAALKTVFNTLYTHDGFCRGMTTWSQEATLYQTVGQLFIEASNPHSAFSRYFVDVKKMVMKPENDRLQYLLQGALTLVNETHA